MCSIVFCPGLRCLIVFVVFCFDFYLVVCCVTTRIVAKNVSGTLLQQLPHSSNSIAIDCLIFRAQPIFSLRIVQTTILFRIVIFEKKTVTLSFRQDNNAVIFFLCALAIAHHNPQRYPHKLCCTLCYCSDDDDESAASSSVSIGTCAPEDSS